MKNNKSEFKPNYNKYKSLPKINNNDLIFGIRSVIEAIDAGKEIDKILIKKGLQSDLLKELLELIKLHKLPAQFVPIEKIDRISKKNHQGVLAFISPVTYQQIEDIIPLLFEEGKVPFVLILDGITDVRNFGAIARTAECSGIHAIIIPNKGAAQVNADAIKTSAGALHKIPICRVESLYKTSEFLQKSGLKLVGASEHASSNYYEKSFSEPLAIVMGAEDNGLSTDMLKRCDELVKIPLLGEIESLNVSVAAGILLFEAVKQRKLA